MHVLALKELIPSKSLCYVSTLHLPWSSIKYDDFKKTCYICTTICPSMIILKENMDTGIYDH